MNLGTGNVLEVTFDDPALSGKSIHAILIGKERNCYAILTTEKTLAYIDETNVKKNYGSTFDTDEIAFSVIDNWKGSVKPTIV